MTSSQTSSDDNCLLRFHPEKYRQNEHVNIEVFIQDVETYFRNLKVSREVYNYILTQI